MTAIHRNTKRWRGISVSNVYWCKECGDQLKPDRICFCGKKATRERYQSGEVFKGTPAEMELFRDGLAKQYSFDHPYEEPAWMVEARQRLDQTLPGRSNDLNETLAELRREYPNDKNKISDDEFENHFKRIYNR